MPARRPDSGGGGLIVDVLGSGSARPTAARDTSSLLVGAVGAGKGWTLIDCPGSVVHKLARRGLVPENVDLLLLTHDHVDHVYGLPHLLQALAIGGSTATLDVAAPAQTLATVEAMVRAHRLDRDRYPKLRLQEIAATERAEVAARDGLLIRCSPAAHERATVSVRIDVEDASVCYSSDTRPNDATAELARDVDLLLHDCGGPQRRAAEFGINHASAAEAAQIAARAGAGRLALIHLGVDGRAEEQECLDEARRHFDGEVILATDGVRWHLGEGA